MPADRGGRAPVGYVLDFFPQLSETFVENELRAMRALGVDVVAFSMFRPHPDLVGPTTLDPQLLLYRPNLAVLAVHFGFWAARRPRATAQNVALALRLRSLTMMRGAWSAGWVATRLRRAKAGHVHAHFAHDAACTAMAASRLSGLPFTFTLHAHELYQRTNGLIERCLGADRVVTVCEYNIRELTTRYPAIPREKIALIYCGVDVADFAFVERNHHEGPAKLLSVGRLVRIKGFDDLIRAVGLLRDEGVAVECEIVGRGPMRSELQDLVRQLKLDRQVVLTGPLPPPVIATRMASCDVFVLACRVDDDGNRDSMPVVIKEAMASGAPVVSTRVVGVPEMVDDSNGRMAQPQDPVSLAHAIAEVLGESLDNRRAMGRRGRDRVEASFNLFTETMKLRDLFDELRNR